MRYYLVGAILEEVAGYTRGPGTDEPLSAQRQKQIASSLEQLAPCFKSDQWERTFLTGLDYLIDSMQRAAGQPP